MNELEKRQQELKNQYVSGAITLDQFESESKKLVDSWLSQAADGKIDLSQLTRMIASSPASQRYYSQLEAKKQAGQLSGKLSIAMNALLGAGFTAASLGQMADAKRYAQQLGQAPALAPVPGRDPYLAEALNRAAQGVVNPNANLNVARAGIQDAYNTATNRAGAISGGQAGAYSSLVNAANMQRMKANLGLAPLAQEALLQNAQVQNQLIGQRLGETQNMFNNQFYNAQLGDQRYARQAAAVGALGQAGRNNLYNTAYRAADAFSQLPYFSNNIPGTNVPRNAPQETLDEELARFERAAADRKTNNKFGSAVLPFDQNDNDFIQNAYRDNLMHNYWLNRSFHYNPTTIN